MLRPINVNAYCELGHTNDLPQMNYGDGVAARARSSSRARLGQSGGLATSHARPTPRQISADHDGHTTGLPCRAGKPVVRIEGGRLLSPELRGAVIALGNFDGCHFGHQEVVGRAVAMARDLGVAAIAATFDPHPVQHFMPDGAPFQLTTLAQRQRMLAVAGVDAMMVFSFNGTLANVAPEDFVTRCLAGAGGVVTGGDFRFGRQRAGNASFLAQVAAQQGMVYEAVGAVALGGAVVSSSRIRQALREGDCDLAQRLLTRPFAISGTLRCNEAGCDRTGCWTAVVALGAYLRPIAGSYAACLRLRDGREARCIARVESSRAERASQDMLRLDVRGLADDLNGQTVEVDLLGWLATA